MPVETGAERAVVREGGPDPRFSAVTAPKLCHPLPPMNRRRWPTEREHTKGMTSPDERGGSSAVRPVGPPSPATGGDGRQTEPAGQENP